MKTRSKPWTYTFALGGVTAMLLGVACGGRKEPPKSGGGPPATVVDVIVTKLSAVQNEWEVNGEVVANEFVELHPEVSGRLTFLSVPEGTHIAQGTVVARINDADLQAQHAKTKVQLDLARQTEARLKQLLAVNGINQADYDAALNQVNSLEADLRYTEALIEKTVVKAPFSGTLGLRQVSPGAYVTPATTIATLQQVQQLKIDFSVPDEYSSRVKKGDTVQVDMGWAGTRKARAVVSAVEPQVSRDTRTLKVRATLQDASLQPGAFVKVYLGRDSAVRNILIPTNAIIPEAMSKKVVTVKGGKAAFVAVETGQRFDRLIAVTDGLQSGDTVVVDGVLFARPGAPVKVREVKPLDQLIP